MDDFKALLIICLIAIAIIGGIIGAANIFDSMQCKKLGQETEMETKYSFIGGCYIKTEKGFIPAGAWRVVD